MHEKDSYEIAHFAGIILLIFSFSPFNSQVMQNALDEATDPWGVKASHKNKLSRMTHDEFPAYLIT